MSSDIQVGDLVCIVKPATCCGYDGTVGEFYIVLEIATTGTSECVHCGDVKMSHDAKIGDDDWIELSRLKKIPPLSELECIDEKLTAEA